MSELATFAAQVAIDGPLPEAPPYGLVPSASIVPDADTHWMNGARVYPFIGDTPSVFATCSAGSDRFKNLQDDLDLPDFAAFTVYLNLRCTGATIGTEQGYAEFVARLLNAFGAVESYGVEHEFAFGDSEPLSPHLTTGADVLASGAPVGPEEGLALLEDAIGDTGRRGMIHATPSTVSIWDARTERAGTKLQTKLGNVVVAGGGYIDAVPDGAAALTADQQYAWATGPVQIRRSTVFTVPGDIADALTLDNDVSAFAERTYLVDWDTQLQAAVLIDRSL